MFLLLLTSLSVAAQPLDDFTTANKWQSAPATGVELNISSDKGRTGNAMRLDFNFRTGGGYAIARLPVVLDLPENYEFSFWIRGDTPVQTLEFKVVDPSGDNVWWTTRPRWRFPAQWTRLRIKKRHLQFAWGPQGGGEIRKTSSLEIVITAAEGGRGTVWIDDLTFTPLPPETPYTLTPKTSWRGSNYEIDFLKSREYGGAMIEWGANAPADYDVQVSDDRKDWRTIWRVRGGDGGSDWIMLPEGESRYVRIAAKKRGEIRDVTFLDPKTGETKNNFFEHLARNSPRGHYPRYLLGQQSYWTVMGAPADEGEALINEEGAIDIDPIRFTIEPFLYVRETAPNFKIAPDAQGPAGSRRPTDGTLLTWADATHTQSLAESELPIPTVVRQHKDMRLTITAWDRGEAGHSVLWVRYRVENLAPARRDVTLHLALRPLQVNPPWQFLAIRGGSAELLAIEKKGDEVVVNGETHIVPVTKLDGFGAQRFDQGDLVAQLAQNRPPDAEKTDDEFGSASGVLSWSLDLGINASRDVVIAIPFHGRPAYLTGSHAAEAAAEIAERELAVSTTAWQSRLGRVGIRIPGPDARISRAIRSQLAYILINQDGPSIEPGARSYDRSWIRDGSLTSNALLRLDHAEEVIRFAEWYARYQREDGYVPCCVDARGPDAVPEHDSHGQFIYLIAETYQFTKDRKFLERMWPHVLKTVDFIDKLRHERMTPEYQTEEKKVFYGLVPESISHEGYSAKPMHSYWDDTFILRGLKDAVNIAEILGRKDEAARFTKIRDEFQRNFHDSMALAMARQGIDFLPGSAELGDFDATSTTTMINPGGEKRELYESLRRTFERYWEDFDARRDGRKQWENYTPYEWRVVGSLLRLGERNRALEAIDWFFSHSRPAGWNHWAEVVFSDPLTPRFIGDMPHTWVGSDFIRSMIDLLAYEREEDQALVIGAGVPLVWVTREQGLAVTGLRTPYGPLSYTMAAEGGQVMARISDGIEIPPGGIVVVSPRDGTQTVVRELPARVPLGSVPSDSRTTEFRVPSSEFRVENRLAAFPEPGTRNPEPGSREFK